MTRRLRAPVGTDEVNVGETRMHVADDGTVDVPDEAVAALTGTGGFTIADDDDVPPAPEGFLYVVSTTGVEGMSWGGVSYEPDAKGVFAVPAAAMSDLLAHGFIPGVKTPDPAPAAAAASTAAQPATAPVIPTLASAKA